MWLIRGKERERENVERERERKCNQFSNFFIVNYCRLIFAHDVLVDLHISTSNAIHAVYFSLKIFNWNWHIYF